MIKIEHSIFINRPVEEVFAAYTNLENHPKWHPGILEAVKTPDGPIGVGTTWRIARKVLGVQRLQESEVTEYKLNRNYVHRSKSPFPVEVRQTYEAVEGGTRITVTVEAEPGGFFKLAEPLLKSMSKRDIDAGFANLKELMEAHAL